MIALNGRVQANKRPITSLAEDVTIYRITPDELEKYDPSVKNRSEVEQARQNGQQEFMMIMFPESSVRDAVDDVGKIVMLTEKMCGKHINGHTEALIDLKRRGYILIRKPEQITKMQESLPPGVIRSFKDDLFPDSDVKRRHYYNDTYRA